MVIDAPNVFHELMLDLYHVKDQIVFELKLERPNITTKFNSQDKQIMYTTVPQKFNEDVMRSMIQEIPFEWYWPNNESINGLKDYFDCIQKIFLRSLDVYYDYDKGKIIVKRSKIPKGLVHSEMKLADGNIYVVLNYNFYYFFKIQVFHAKDDGSYDL